MLDMTDAEFGQRIVIAGVFAWGYLIKLLLMGYQEDKANPDVRLTFNKWLWFNSQKWRVIGSGVFLLGLAFVAPHEGFIKLQDYVFYGVPVGHLSTAAIGFMGDDFFVGLDSVRDYVKEKINRKVKNDGTSKQ